MSTQRNSDGSEEHFVDYEITRGYRRGDTYHFPPDDVPKYVKIRISTDASEFEVWEKHTFAATRLVDDQVFAISVDLEIFKL